MKKIFLQLLPMVASLLNFDPEAKEELNFTDEQKAKLDKHAKQDGLAEAFQKYYNEEYLHANEQALEAYKQFMEANSLAQPNAEQDSEDDAPGAPEVPVADQKTVATALQQLVKKAEGLVKTNAQLAADNEKLKKLPEPDAPEAVIDYSKTKANTVKHSNTHLFASQNDYDALDRPWNKNAFDATTGILKPNAATVWDKVNIDKLNTDLGAYARRNSSEIMDLLMDGYDIPAHWSVVSNIQDQHIFTSIVTGEITQAFKKAYLPKNKQRFVPVINKIYDKQIDGEWQSSELKSIEKSWLNMFFNEGSTPYKDSFARYLIERILNQARKEDKISIFKGVYSDPELQPDTAGSFLNSMSGFLKVVQNHKNVDYKPHSLANLTQANTYTVIQNWLENDIPIDVRNQPGLKLGVGNDVFRWYMDGRETAKGLMPTYSRDEMHPEDFMNIQFVKHPQLEGTGFIYLTTEDNIGLMVDRPGEESLITVEKDARAIKFFADYKLGVYFKAFGASVDPNEALNYDNQIFFSNDVDPLTAVYAPVTANDATPSFSEHNALKLGSNNTAATDVTGFDDVVEGTYYYLMGDSATNISTIKDNANIILSDGDFGLGKGDTMVLIGLSGGKVIEYSRTDASAIPDPEKVTLAADATTADASTGTWFVTAANTGATAITDITNAVDGEIYTIEGGSNTNSTTIASGGNFLLTAGFTASLGSQLIVRYNGSKFVELSRA